MSVVVGYQPDRGGDDALELAASFATALDTDLAIVIATPRPWPTPSSARVDAEFAEYAQRFGSSAAAKARSHLADRVAASAITVHRSTESTASRALLGVVAESAGDVLVLGATHTGADGRLKLGTTTGRLLHSSPVPLALAPGGYACQKLTKLTCAFTGEASSVDVVAAARDFANRLSVPLRIATFGVPPAGMFPPEVGLDVERGVLEAWREQIAQAQTRLVAEGVVAAGVETVIGTGESWDAAVDAIDWRDGEVLALGTTPRETAKRVFLGSRASRIVASARVPVIILPG